MWKNPHYVLTYLVCTLYWMWDVPGWHNKNDWTLQPVKLSGQDKEHPRKWSQMIYYFICFPFFLLFHMSRKVPGLTKYTFQQVILPCQKEISVQAGKMLLKISYWKIFLNLQCDLQCSLIISLPIQDLTWWFHFY